MQDLGYELRRILIPRTWVNRARRRAETPKSPGPLTEKAGLPLVLSWPPIRRLPCLAHSLHALLGT
jgi:hypothetical protein